MARNNTSLLEALTLELWVDNQVEKEVFESTALSKKLYTNRKTDGGSLISKNVALDMDNPMAAFDVGDSYTPTTLDNVDSLKVNYKNFGGALELSEIELSQNSTAEGRVNMMTDALDTFKRWQQEEFSNQLWRGTYSSKKWAGISGYWMANQTGDVGGLTRNLSQQLVPWIIRADDIYSTSAGTVSVTADSTAVTGSSTSFSTDNIKAGSIIKITDGSGVVHTHIVATVSSDTAIVLATTYKGSTASGLSYSISGHFSDTDFYGASRKFTIEKATHAQRVCGNSGMERPDLGCTTSGLFERFEAMLRAKNNGTIESNDPGIKGFDNFLFNRTPIVQDPKACDASTGAPHLYFFNTKFMYLQFLKGWDKYELKPNESGHRLVRVDSSSGEQFATLIGQVVMSGNLILSAANRQSVLKEIDA
jgi:hypothetical protein